MPGTSHGTGFREHTMLVSRFLRSPNTVGAIAASGRTLALGMVRDLPTDRPLNIVELGPGTGPFTNAIVQRVHPDSKILAIDREPTFVDWIKGRWPTVDCVCASAVELARLVRERNMAPLDHMISGLPFASLPVDETQKILDAIQQTLKPGGTFTTFQYLHGFGLRPGRVFRKTMSERMGGPVHRRLVLKNFPPAFILTWTNQATR